MVKHGIVDIRTYIVPGLILMRPWNCLSAALAVLAGAHVSGAGTFKIPVVLASLTAAAITGGGNATNDYFDREIDAINKPGRPLPACKIKPRSAMLLAGALYIVGVGLSLPLGIIMLVIATGMVLLANLYSWKLKRSFLIGNVLVAFLSSMTVVYGGLTIGRPGPTLAAMLVIFVFMLCREILKTVGDDIGDAAYNARTVTVLLGRSTAVRLFAGGAVITVGLVLCPSLTGQVNGVYLALALLGVVPVLVAGAVGLWLWPEQRHVSFVLQATKLVFFIWLVAMLAR